MINLTNRIKKIFDKLKDEKRKAFVSFSVGGYPNEESSLEIAKGIVDSGAHIHEISFPHAEAQADGPIIQLANIESIDKGINLKKIINITKEVRNHNSEIGLCMMGYLNNLFIYGIEKFAKEVSDVIDAVICVDLPTDVVEEKQLREVLKKENISLIKLITPTTSDERIKKIVKDAEGFVYSVNVEGQTGVKSADIDKVNSQIERIKKFTKIPVVSGFGIKTEEDVRTFSNSKADGIVLGSAIVKEIQKKSFIEHISAASQLNIPIIVHSRNAEVDTYEILKSESKNSNLKVLIHCFTGSRDFAKKLIDLNFYISVSGIITFKKSIELADTVSSIPMENLLVETDSPYLAPLPYRGKDNEPSYIIHTVEKLSQIKKLPNESIVINTTNNFMKLFNLT